MNAYKQYVFSSTTAGGARLAAALARLALIDEYRLLAHPVVSPGAAWFDRSRTSMACS
jgi:dihydrofolate reductase